MSEEKKPPFNCLLGIDPDASQKRKPSECPECGWNKDSTPQEIFNAAEYRRSAGCAFVG